MIKTHIFLIILLLPISSLGSNNFTENISLLDEYIRSSKFESATKQTFYMLENWGEHPEIIHRANRLNQLVELEKSFNENYTFNLPRYVREYENRTLFYQKFTNPKDSEVLISFLATASILLGANYVSNWVDSQENPSNRAYNEDILSIQVQTGKWISTTFDDFRVKIFKKTPYSKKFIADSSAGSGVFEVGYAYFRGLEEGDYLVEIIGVNNNREAIFGKASISYNGGKETCIIKMSTESINCYEN